MNRKLLTARKQKRWSIEKAAEVIGVGWRTYQRWEHGTQEPQLYNLDRMCKIFGAEPQELGFAHLVEASAATTKTSLTPMTKLVSGTTSVVDMFEIGVMALLLAQQQYQYSTDELLTKVSYSLKEIEMHRPNQDSGSFSRRQALLFLAKLPFAFLGLTRMGASSPLFAEEIIPLCATSIPACWRLYFLGGISEIEQVLPSYLMQLSTLAQQTATYQKLAATLTSQAYQLDWLIALQHQDFGRALASIKQAFMYGDIADDNNLRLSSLVRQAHIAFHLKRPMQQLLLHQKAMHYSNDVSPLLRGWLYVVSAESHAHLGQEEEARRFLDFARETFPDHPEDDPNASYVPINQYTLANYEVLACLHLKQPKKAWDLLTEVEKTIPTAIVPRRVELWSRQTATSLALGDLDQTCTYFELNAVSAKQLGSNLRYNEACETYEQMQLTWPHEGKIKVLAELLQP
jgi:transcriptional regulator with XRE-family HTH domain